MKETDSVPGQNQSHPLRTVGGGAGLMQCFSSWAKAPGSSLVLPLVPRGPVTEPTVCLSVWVFQVPFTCLPCPDMV